MQASFLIAFLALLASNASALTLDKRMSEISVHKASDEPENQEAAAQEEPKMSLKDKITEEAIHIAEVVGDKFDRRPKCDNHYACGGGACTKGRCQKPVTAKIYLMNMDSRKDRCRCFKEQVESADRGVYHDAANSIPYPVVRVISETPATYHETCNDIRLPDHGSNRGGVSGGAESALMCTNWKIWRAAWEEYQRGEGSNFTIMAEDDVLINKETFWPRLMEFLNGPCQEWDHVRTDTFWNDDYSPAGFWNPNGDGTFLSCYRAQPNQEFEEDLRKSIGQGNHFLILRTASLGKMIQQAWDSQGDDNIFVADHFHFVMASRPDFRLKTWQARVVAQMGYNEQGLGVPPECDGGIAASNIAGGSGWNEYWPGAVWDGLPKWGDHPWDHKEGSLLELSNATHTHDVKKDLKMREGEKDGEKEGEKSFKTHKLPLSQYKALKVRMATRGDELVKMPETRQEYLRELLQENAELHSDGNWLERWLKDPKAEEEAEKKKFEMFLNFQSCY